MNFAREERLKKRNNHTNIILNIMKRMQTSKHGAIGKKKNKKIWQVNNNNNKLYEHDEMRGKKMKPRQNEEGIEWIKQIEEKENT